MKNLPSLPSAAPAAVSAQEAAIATLERAGFVFANWTRAYEETEGDTAVMVKRGRHGREYREVSPTGEVN